MIKKFLLSGLILTLLAGCGGAPERETVPGKKETISARTVAVQEVDWPITYEAVGTVRATTSTVVAAKVMGYAQEVSCRVGDQVRAGQVLVRLDARDLEISLRGARAALDEARDAATEAQDAIASAKANLDLAEVTFTRMQELYEKKSISRQEFDEAAARLQTAQAAHQMARSRGSQIEARIRQAEEGVAAAEVVQGYARITAPFDGVVTARQVEPGTLAAPGMPLLTIERGGAFRLEAAVAESYLPRIRTGQAVTVILEAVDKTLTAKVTEVVPAMDEATRSFTVKIDLPAMPEIRSGLFGRALFDLGARRVLAVPAGAVVERGQLQSVFVVENGAVANRLVTLGASRQENREVLSGLAIGERVVCPVPPGIEDGARLEVRP